MAGISQETASYQAEPLPLLKMVPSHEGEPQARLSVLLAKNGSKVDLSVKKKEKEPES